MSIRRAILLAAGYGMRLRPLTDILPKCLMPINGRPLLEWWLRALSSAGVESFLVNLHHHRELVRTWLRYSPYADRVTFSEEPELLGTGGTLLANSAFCDGQSTLLVHADNLCRCDWRDFFEAHEHRSAGTAMTMMTFDTDRPETCGIVETDADGVVHGFHEKVADPPGRRANAAVYIIEQEVVDYLWSLGKPVIDFSTEVLPRFIDRIATWHNTAYLRDIGTPSNFLTAQREWMLPGFVPEGTDGWTRLCLANDKRLVREFAACLEAALGRRQIFLPFVKAGFCARGETRHYSGVPMAFCATDEIMTEEDMQWPSGSL